MPYPERPPSQVNHPYLKQVYLRVCVGFSRFTCYTLHSSTSPYSCIWSLTEKCMHHFGSNILTQPWRYCLMRDCVLATLTFKETVPKVKQQLFVCVRILAEARCLYKPRWCALPHSHNLVHSHTVGDFIPKLLAQTAWQYSHQRCDHGCAQDHWRPAPFSIAACVAFFWSIAACVAFLWSSSVAHGHAWLAA